MKRLRDIVQPGDVLCTYNRDAIVSKGIILATGLSAVNVDGVVHDLPVSHVAICYTRRRTIEALVDGVSQGLVKDYEQSEDFVIVFRPPRPKSQIREYLKVAKKRIGINYPYFQLILDLVIILVDRIFGVDLMKKLPDFFTGIKCSELHEIAQRAAYNVETIPGVRPAYINPRHVAESNFMTLIHVQGLE